MNSKKIKNKKLSTERWLCIFQGMVRQEKAKAAKGEWGHGERETTESEGTSSRRPSLCLFMMTM
jgi:hypothetical protein